MELQRRALPHDHEHSLELRPLALIPNTLMAVFQGHSHANSFVFLCHLYLLFVLGFVFTCKASKRATGLTYRIVLDIEWVGVIGLARHLC